MTRNNQTLVAGLEIVRSKKTVLAVTSFAAYAFLFGWQFSLLLILSLLVHEYGHVWAMRRSGMRVKGVYLLPFIGAAAVSEDSFTTRANESYVALMGPVWGLFLSFGLLLSYVVFGHPLLAALAGWTALLNLFNLLPINPMDGGRILKSLAFSVSNRVGVASMICGLLMILSLFLVATPLVVLFLLIIGLLDLATEGRRIQFEEDHRNIIKALAGLARVEPNADSILKFVSTLEWVSPQAAGTLKIKMFLAALEARKLWWGPGLRSTGKAWYRGKLAIGPWITASQRDLFPYDPADQEWDGEVCVTKNGLIWTRDDDSGIEDSPLAEYLRSPFTARTPLTHKGMVLHAAMYLAIGIALVATAYLAATTPGAIAAFRAMVGV